MESLTTQIRKLLSFDFISHVAPLNSTNLFIPCVKTKTESVEYRCVHCMCITFFSACFWYYYEYFKNSVYTYTSAFTRLQFCNLRLHVNTSLTICDFSHASFFAYFVTLKMLLFNLLTQRLTRNRIQTVSQNERPTYLRAN